MWVWLLIIILAGVVIGGISFIVKKNNEEKTNLERNQKRNSLQFRIEELDRLGVEVSGLLFHFNEISNKLFPNPDGKLIISEEIYRTIKSLENATILVETDYQNGTAKMKPKFGIKIDPKTKENLKNAGNAAGTVIAKGIKGLWNLGNKAVKGIVAEAQKAMEQDAASQAPSTSNFPEEPDLSEDLQPK